ncbi:acetyl-CoA synthetase-like protein [Sporormia fimetaria CBS 119925]|uniref:Acetyl-CoA synthetase-like protein n=1 Tax=Sporormia fimetaria CBS 119925 TaxID=1340428 RepID=A0A6A6V7Q9_9PLEO|nr:acetyl-CoA synthetase-like protein [Sporormia fimetaria CBS 119925]
MTATQQHPQFRRELLNHIVDRLARDSPDKLYAESPISATTFEDDFRKIRYRELANAVNGVAALIEKSLGKGEASPTLVYYGPADVRYIILVLGAVKAGYKMLLPSSRLSPIAAVELLEKSDAEAILLPTPRPAAADPVLELYPMQEIAVPELEELLKTKYAPYSFEANFEDIKGEPLVVLHTSGTTGFPKPIVWTHEWAASFGEELYLTPPSGYESLTNLMLGKRIFHFFPPFHAAYLAGVLVFPLLTGTVNICALPGAPPTAEQVAFVVEHAKVDILGMIPPIIAQLGSNPELLDRVAARVEYIMYAGGDVPFSAGEAVSKKMKLFTQVASTETGLIHTLRRTGEWKRENWHHVMFHPSSGVKLIKRQGKSFEAIVHRSAGAFKQAPFVVFPDIDEFATGDLFKQHEEDPELWEYHGRMDDMQVLLSTEKFYPVDMEQFLCLHKDIKEAMFIGNGRTQPALLLELENIKEDGQGIPEHIWEQIEDANEISPEFAIIARENVLLLDPERPWFRTPKGTVQREATRKLYLVDLERLDAVAEKHHASELTRSVELIDV